MDQVHYPGIANVRAVFLESEAQQIHPCSRDLFAIRDHVLHGLLGNVDSHAVVDTPARQNDLWVVADLFRFVSEIVGIDADAVSAHQSRAKGQEVPFGPGRLQDLQRVQPEPVENDG